jgi:hypothetical protein
MNVVDPRVQLVLDEHPEIVALVREVDRSLLRWSLGLSPFERLRILNQRARDLARFEHVAP